MPLRIELAPNERLIIGDAAIRNGPRKTEFVIETQTKVLRERDMITEGAADTPCKRLYVALEFAYLANDPVVSETRAMALANEIMESVPSMRPGIAEIFEAIFAGDHYKALRRAKKLLAYEDQLLTIARGEGPVLVAAE